MKVDLNNPVPDVCELIAHDGTDWRVAGWYKLVKVKKPDESISSRIINDLLRKDPESVGYVLVQCIREEATVVEIVAVCGGLVRISDVKRSGEYVEWNDKCIEEHREEAIRRTTDKNLRFSGIGRGHKDLLQRLFPEVDFTYPW